ncbi:MAG: ATP-binding protein [Saprospiraceae bacterium]|nr:ATP-binding protein [Saprospiraceae bacterium]
MIKRNISEIALKLFDLYPILSITGPRQSGKTTLIRNLFKGLKYVSLEDPDVRELAIKDPRGFLSNYSQGAIFDEIQQAPDLFSYLQTIVDESGNPGQFVISGSQNFLLMEKISQSLAGRVAVLKLLPLSQDELRVAGKLLSSIENTLFAGAYPAIFSNNIPANIFYSNYIQTYIERDVRTLINIGNLQQFHLFIQLCAGRIGQPLNYSSLASDCGISVNTAKAWISVLVNSYIIFLLPPHHKNFNKRLIKMPKLYFFDTGLVSYLLKIESFKQIGTHYLIGSLFENYIITEMMKYRFNRAKESNLYFWKDNKGKEIDILIEQADLLIPIEIKSAKTNHLSAFDNIKYFNQIRQSDSDKTFVINATTITKSTSIGSFIGWNNLNQIFSEIF